MKKLYILLLLCFVLSTVCSVEAAKVNMGEQAAINGTQIFLGDIAEVTGDGFQVEQLKRVNLGTAAQPGKSMVLTKNLIFNRLMGAGIDLNTLELNIPESMVITTNSQVIGGYQIQEWVEKAIRSQLPQTKEVEYTFEVSALDDIVLPVGELSYSVNFPYGFKFVTPTIAVVTVEVGQSIFAKVTARVAIHRFEQIVMATTVIPAQTIITADMCALKKVETSGLKNYLGDVTQAAGLAARQLIQPGMILTTQQLIKPVILKRNSFVEIMAQVGHVRVSAVGMALQDASIGQVIRVQNQATRRIIMAEVIDNKTVQVLTLDGK